MWRLIKDLVLGEPVLVTGLISTGLGSWVAALVAAGETVPLPLAIAVPTVTFLGAWYDRQRVSPTAKLPEFTGEVPSGHDELTS
jgi:hypothetical protein